MVAIMLYAEMPIAVFEAKRQKEQLLIDRGNEYAHAVKLYVRKFGVYPATVDQLEDTNRMRFLRRRFTDPFTGKDNWRLLHAGPGGMLIDSKVKPVGLGQTPANATDPTSGSTNGGTGFGSSAATATTALGEFGFGPSSQSATGDSSSDVAVPNVPKRPPAIPASSSPPSANSSGAVGSTAADGDQTPGTSLMPEDLRAQMAAVEQAQPAALTASAGQTGSAEPVGASASQSTQDNVSGQSPATGTDDAQNATGTGRNVLNSAIGGTLQGSRTAGAAAGQIYGGGIAGVASAAHGQSIKTVNDQSDYSLWEFYYDPTKDALRNFPRLGASQPITNTGAPGMNTSGLSGFGQNNTASSPAPTSPDSAPKPQ